MLCRPYQGVWHDAGLYLGRVAADLDPTGIGRDRAFQDDGQFGLTVFPVIAEQVARALGVGPAAMLLVAAGLPLWLAAMAFLLSRIASGSRLWFMLVCVAVLPATYSAAGALRFGEAIATPRVFAEAGVLAALGFLVAGRRWTAAAFLLAAAAFHPIMALTGGAVLYLELCVRDRRWLALGGLALVGGVAGALAGLPVLERLLVRFDPAWGGTLDIYPSLVRYAEWTLPDWSRAAVQIGSLLIGASLLSGLARTVLLCVAAAGALGPLFVEGWGSVLLTQAQPWRVLWLPAALGAAMAGYAALELWTRGAAGRLTVTALALAWTGMWIAPVGLAALAVALASHAAMLRGRPWPIDRRLPLLFGLAAAALHLLLVGVTIAAVIEGDLLDKLFPMAWLSLDLHGAPLALAAAVLVLRWDGRPPAGRSARGVLVAALAALTLAAFLWDARRPEAVALDTAQGAPRLRAMLASRPGEILWLGGRTQTWFQTWFVAGRPAYWSPYQGAPRVFSRPLAVEWARRGDRLVALGVTGPYGRGGRPDPDARDLPLRAEPVRRLCADADAPVWILAAIDRLGPGVPVAGVWRSRGGPAYALIPCRNPAAP